MLLIRSFLRPVLSLIPVLLLCGPLTAATWSPVAPAELASRASPLDPDAIAEILAHETSIDDADLSDTQREVYRRIKVYTKAGVDKFSVIDIPFVRRRSVVRRIEARVVKPDGTSLELNPKDVYEREVIRSSDVRLRVKSFAPPGLEPGCILEYRYVTEEQGMSFFNAFSFNDDDVPTRSAVYRFRPFSGGIPVRLQAVFFNMPTRRVEERPPRFL